MLRFLIGVVSGFLLLALLLQFDAKRAQVNVRRRMIQRAAPSQPAGLQARRLATMQQHLNGGRYAVRN